MPAVFARHEIGFYSVGMDAPFSPRARFARLTPCFLLLSLLWLATPVTPGRAAAGQPVTIKELCLMLRGGYTGDEVLRETAGRPLLEPLDADAEAALRQSGADAHLLDALRKTRRTLSDDEAAAARQRQADLDARDAATRQAELARLQPAAAAASGRVANGAHWTAQAGRPNDTHFVENLLRGKLVSLQNGSLLPESNSALDGKRLFGLYYSSYMSRAGHEFTPDLIQFYERTRTTHPEFQIVLVSGDSSPFAMDNLMHREEMPWPAVAYDQISQIKMVERFLEHGGASRLMIADGTGWVMADYRISVSNNNLPLVLSDLERVLANPTVLSGMSPPQTMTPGAGGSIGAPGPAK